MQLYNNLGQRLYLSPEERLSFLKMAINHSQHDKARTFVRTLAYTGCRLSEALELTSDRIDFTEGVLIFRTLNKRKVDGEAKQHWRAVPVPSSFIDELNLVHGLKRKKNRSFYLWNITRKTGWVWCKGVMEQMGLEGSLATAKGLRHAFAVACIENNIPLPVIQKWMGHSSIQTTAHYMQIVGAEEQSLASRMWK